MTARVFENVDVAISQVAHFTEGRTLTQNANGTWSNAGTMSADGGTLRLNNNWSNTGTISVMNGGILETTGAWSNAGGTMNATSAAVVRLGGSSTVATRPGVCPIRKKRASRRLSDSKALTGNVT